jgi:glycine hydroxymethyltransferase
VVKEKGRINYEKLFAAAMESKPKMIIGGASAYPREIDFYKMKEVAEEVGAYLMVDMAHIAGLVAAGLHMSPVPHSDVVTTTTHKTLRGPRGGRILSRYGAKYGVKINRAVFPGIQGGPLMHVIAAKAVSLKEAWTQASKSTSRKLLKTPGRWLRPCLSVDLNWCPRYRQPFDPCRFKKQEYNGSEAQSFLILWGYYKQNAIPYDPQPPNIASGIRIGTPAVTTRPG